MANSDDFYLELVNEVAAILDEFGTTYGVRADGVYNSDTLETTDGVSRTVVGLVSTQDITATFAGLTQTTGEGWIAKKTLILRNDANPQAGEEVQVDGDWFPLSKVVPIKPAEITVLYMLDVTR